MLHHARMPLGEQVQGARPYKTYNRRGQLSKLAGNAGHQANMAAMKSRPGMICVPYTYGPFLLSDMDEDSRANKYVSDKLRQCCGLPSWRQAELKGESSHNPPPAPYREAALYEYLTGTTRFTEDGDFGKYETVLWLTDEYWVSL